MFSCLRYFSSMYGTKKEHNLPDQGLPSLPHFIQSLYAICGRKIKQTGSFVVVPRVYNHLTSHMAAVSSAIFGSIWSFFWRMSISKLVTGRPKGKTNTRRHRSISQGTSVWIFQSQKWVIFCAQICPNTLVSLALTLQIRLHPSSGHVMTTSAAWSLVVQLLLNWDVCAAQSELRNKNQHSLKNLGPERWQPATDPSKTWTNQPSWC